MNVHTLTCTSAPCTCEGREPGTEQERNRNGMESALLQLCVDTATIRCTCSFKTRPNFNKNIFQKYDVLR